MSTTRAKQSDLLISRTLSQIPWLRHGVTTRDFAPVGTSQAEGLQRLRVELGVPAATTVHAQQKHTANVELVDDALLQRAGAGTRFVFPNTDAIVSIVPNAMIAVSTADCLPILLACKKTRIIGIVHAGWRGTYARIADAAARCMFAAGADANSIVAYLAPASAGCCYEVSEEMIEQFITEFVDAAADGVQINDGRLLNIVALNTWQLAKAGISASNIEDSGICTIEAKDRFFSYRADNGTTGRIISALCVTDG